MRGGARHGIILLMLPFIERAPRGSALRYLSVVATVLAILISGVVSGEKSAGATLYDSEELQFLQLINRYRENNGVGPLILSNTLAVAAERHSKDMAQYRFFAHKTVSSSYYRAGSQPWNRMAAEGYDYNTFKGENIAVGCEAAERCFELWRNSPPHNAAMLDGRYRVIGIARINTPGSVHRWYWTTDFGGTLDSTSHAPGESSQARKTNEEPTPKPQDETRDKPVEDGAGIENGEMNGKAVWEQEAKDGADLILDGYARLGDYDNGKDDLHQKIRVGENTELSYEIKIETTEHRHPSDRLIVRITDRNGEQLAVLRRYTDGDAGGWRRHRIDLSRFAGRTVYLSFFVETDPMLRTAFYLDRVALGSKERS
jgi:uncharacterized protein YkwD